MDLIVSAVWSGGVSALVAYLSIRWNEGKERRRYTTERLGDLYAQLVAIATTDVQRAKVLEAMAALGIPEVDTPSRAEWAMEWSRVDAPRLATLTELWQTIVKIRLLESDKELRDTCQLLADRQLFFLPMSTWHDPQFQARIRAYSAEIIEYKKLLDSICDMAVKKYSP